nr:type VII secretion integral membrane protein EccD [Zhihengliuella flava]
MAGDRRRLDLLLPSTAEVGTLMPQILRLLGDTPGERVASKVLLTDTGEPLPTNTTLAEAGIVDGATLSLLNNHEAPPPAVVYDVTDAVVAEAESVRGTWQTRHVIIGSGVAAGAAAVLGLWLLTGHYAPQSAWWILLACGGGLLAAGASLVAASRPIAATLQVTGAALAVLGLAQWEWLPGYGFALLTAAVVVALIAALAGVARRPSAVLTTAGIAGALTALWAGAYPLAQWATADDVDPAAAIAGIGTLGSAVILGLLPSIALNASGLAKLDDARAEGAAIMRYDAVAAVHSAHAALRFGTVATALSAGVGLWLIPETDQPQWTLPLTACLALAITLRARSFPLAVERYALYAAAGLGVVSLSLTLTQLAGSLAWIVAVGLLAAALGAGLGLVVRLADHVQARLRQIAGRIESLAIVASIPLIVGYCGVFSLLLSSF